MNRTDQVEATVEATLTTPIATARVMQFRATRPPDRVMTPLQSHHIDLCLTPRPLNSRARYREHWGPSRFERLGDMFLIPPGETIQFIGDSAHVQRSIVCDFEAEKIGDWLDMDVEWNDRRLTVSLNLSSEVIRFLLRRLYEETVRPGYASNILVECIMSQLAIELGRFCEGMSDDPVSGGLAGWRLRLIDERLRQDGLSPSLSELAELCNMSVRQLTRGFKGSRGCSIGSYIVRSRVEAAKRLLAQDESMKIIAHKTGFSTASSFAYAFRREAGLSPGEFRRRAFGKTN